MKEEHQKACGHGADKGNMFQGIKDANYHSPWRNKVNRLTLRNREVRVIHKILETLLYLLVTPLSNKMAPVNFP